MLSITIYKIIVYIYIYKVQKLSRGNIEYTAVKCVWEDFFMFFFMLIKAVSIRSNILKNVIL